MWGTLLIALGIHSSIYAARGYCKEVAIQCMTMTMKNSTATLHTHFAVGTHYKLLS